MVAVPNPTTVAAGTKNLASTWNTDVRDADTYFLENLGGFGHRNVLVNSHFDVWQSSTSLAITNSATPQYHADQWCTRRNGATGATVSRQTGPTGQRYALRIQRDSGNTSTTVIETMQPLETPESYRLAGQSCQLKLSMKAGANFSAASSLVTVKVTTGTGSDQAPPASGWTGTTDALSTTQAITTTMTDYTFDVTIPSGATQAQVSVTWTPVGTASTNDWVEVSAAQLTVGKCSGWERLPYALQLQRCQRFFYAPPVTGYQVRADGGGSATTIRGWLTFPVPMRIAPTATFPASGTYTVEYALVISGTSTAVPTAAGSDTTCYTFTQAGFTGMANCKGYYIGMPAGFFLSARL